MMKAWLNRTIAVTLMALVTAWQLSQFLGLVNLDNAEVGLSGLTLGLSSTLMIYVIIMALNPKTKANTEGER